MALRLHFMIIYLYLLLRVASSNSTTNALSAGSNLTVLSPTPLTSNGSDLCNFPDIHALLSRVNPKQPNYNLSLSLLVQQCSNVCPMVFGEGNPDISGPGAITSYMIQTATVLIFVLGFAIVVTLYNPTTKQLTSFRKALFNSAENLAYIVVTTNIFVTLSVLIASVFRSSQIPLITEQNFVSLLASFQFLILEAIIVSYGLCWNWFTGGIETIACLLYAPVVSLLCLANYFVGIYSSSQHQRLKDLAARCVTERDYTKLAHSHFFHIAKSIGTALSMFISICIILIIPLKFSRCFSHVRLKYLSSIAILAFTVVWSLLLTLYWVEIKRDQRQIENVSNPSDVDFQWGFGQVSAVCAWAPLVNSIMIEIIGLSRQWRHGRTSDNQNPQPAANATHFNSITTPVKMTVHDGSSESFIAAESTVHISDDFPEETTEEHIRGHSAQSDSNVAFSSTDNLNTPATQPQCSTSSNFWQSNRPQDEHNEAQLSRHTTWPRNVSNTYLPTSELRQ